MLSGKCLNSHFTRPSYAVITQSITGIERARLEHVLVDDRLEAAIGERSRERPDVEVELLRIAGEIAHRQLLLLREQQIVHLPEFALRPRGERRFVRERRILMDRQRAVLE